MNLTTRINNMIEEAYLKGQLVITTTLQGRELFEQDEIDEMITDLRARGFRVSHDDVYNDMTIGMPTFTLAERARMIAYNVDSVTRHYIERISKDIITSSKLGYVEEEMTFYKISDEGIVGKIQEHFSREGFVVTRENDPKRGNIKLTFRWNRSDGLQEQYPSTPNREITRVLLDD